MKRLLVAVIAVVAVIGVGIHARSGDEQWLDAAPVAAGEKSPSVSRARACVFTVGQRRAWSLQSTQALELQLDTLGIGGGPDVASPVTRTETTASLTVEVLTADVLLARFTHVDATTSKTIGEGLTNAFLVRVSNDCSVTQFARHQSTPLFAARTQQALMAELWFKTPRAEAEVVEGENGSGVYTASIARDDDTLRRRIQGYTRYWSSPIGARGALNVEDAVLTVQRDEGLWFASMTGNALTSGPALKRGEATVRVEGQVANLEALADASRLEADYRWENLLPRSVALPKSTELTQAEREHRAQLAELSLDEALTGFALTIERSPNINSQWRELSAYLEARPDQIPLFAAALENGDFPNDVQPAAYLALGKARVTEARDALLAINRMEETNPLNRTQTAFLLADRTDVPASFATELAASSAMLTQTQSSPRQREYARSAVLALGMFAGRQGARAPEVVTAAKSAVREALTLGQSPSELSPAFGALGNIGDPSSLSDIAAWSRDTNPLVRAEVPQSLRRLSIDVETPLMLEWLARETDAVTKRELYGVLQRQMTDEQRALPEVFIKQALTDLKAQPGLLTRQSLVRMLVTRVETHAEVKQALLAQTPIEAFNESGLYDVLAQALPGAEVVAAVQNGAPPRPTLPNVQVPTTGVSP